MPSGAWPTHPTRISSNPCQETPRLIRGTYSAFLSDARGEIAAVEAVQGDRIAAAQALLDEEGEFQGAPAAPAGIPLGTSYVQSENTSPYADFLADYVGGTFIRSTNTFMFEFAPGSPFLNPDLSGMYVTVQDNDSTFNGRNFFLENVSVSVSGNVLTFTGSSWARSGMFGMGSDPNFSQTLPAGEYANIKIGMWQNGTQYAHIGDYPQYSRGVPPVLVLS
jgi:hypothetical protein